MNNESLGIKGNIVAPIIEADMAVLDANLSRGLPSRITAATGMDALTHAVEAITSPMANHFTDANAALLPIVMEALPGFYLPQAERLASGLGIESGGEDAEDLLARVIERISSLQVEIGCDVDFAKYEIGSKDVENIIAAIAADPAALFYAIPHESIEPIVRRASGNRSYG